MVYDYKKAAKESQTKKLKSYGLDKDALGSKVKAKNWAGEDALSTDQQAGRAPLNSKKYIPPEVTPERVAKKKGGAVSGAQSLKRLDKSPRKSKSLTESAARPAMKGTGQRSGEIPSGTSEQENWDPQTKFIPGEMNESSPRKKGGRVAKAYGGGFEALMDDIGSALFGGDEEAAAPAPARRAARPAARPAAHPRGVIKRHITEVEHPVAHGPVEMVSPPMPPRRPAELSAPPAASGSALGRPDEGGQGAFLDRYAYDRNPTPAAASSSPAPTGAAAGMPDEGGQAAFLRSMLANERPQASTPFLTDQLYRKKGGRVQDYTDRSHDAVGKQYRKVSKANGGMAEHEDDDHDDHEDEAMDRALVKKMVKEKALTGRCEGGRMGRAKGGKTTVNIMVGGQPQGGQPQGGPGMDPMLMAALAGAAGGPGAMPPPPPPGAGAGAPPPAMMAPPMMPPAPPPAAGPGGPPMPRKSGGRAMDVQVPYRKAKKDEYGYPKTTFGNNGMGRKQKAEAYGDKQKS